MVDTPNEIVGPQIFNGHFPARRREESARRNATTTRTRASVAATNAGQNVGRIIFACNRTSRLDAFAIEKTATDGTRFAPRVCRRWPRSRRWRRRWRHRRQRQWRRRDCCRLGRRLLRRNGGNEKRRRGRRLGVGHGRELRGPSRRSRFNRSDDRRLGSREFRRRFRLNRRRRRLIASDEHEAETNDCATHAPSVPQMPLRANQISTSPPAVINARACPASPRCPAKARRTNRHHPQPKSCLRSCRTSSAAASNWHTR